MQFEKRAIEEINVSEYNPRVNLSKTTNEYKSIKASIERFGLVEPLVYNKRTNRLISGHQRLNVLKDLGYKEVELSVVDIPEEEEKKLNIALNRITGRWDYEKLYKILLNFEKDIKITGFTPRDLEDLKVKFGDLVRRREERKVNVQIVHKYGEKVQLDQNFLKIGDITNENDINDLVGENKIDLVIADPPFNVQLKTGATKFVCGYKEYEDDMSDEEYYDFSCKWINQMERILKDGGVFYIFIAGKTIDIVRAAIRQNKKLMYHQLIVWDKGYPHNRTHLTGKKFKKRTLDFLVQIELIIYGWKKGKHFISEAAKTMTDIWTIKRVHNLKLQHIAEKPVELMKRMILLSSNEGENVFDAFSGSGSTLIACKETKRRCFSIEKDEEFANKIIARYNNHSNEETVII